MHGVTMKIIISVYGKLQFLYFLFRALW